MAESHRWPLSVQTVLPDSFQENHEFGGLLDEMGVIGLAGVELNIADPWNTDLRRLVDLLNSKKLKLLNFASGLTAKTFGLSLSSLEEEARKKAVDRCADLINLFSGLTDGIIIGYFKGPPSPEVAEARGQFGRSLEVLVPVAESAGVTFVVEATNRYESSVANSLDDSWDLIRPFADSRVKILPDTFHMNIEEPDMPAAFKNHIEHYCSVHLSDNNRFFPGFGAIDFGPLFTHFSSIGFAGDVAIEGNIKGSFLEDLKTSASGLFQNMQRGSG